MSNTLSPVGAGSTQRIASTAERVTPPAAPPQPAAPTGQPWVAGQPKPRAATADAVTSSSGDASQALAQATAEIKAVADDHSNKPAAAQRLRNVVAQANAQLNDPNVPNNVKGLWQLRASVSLLLLRQANLGGGMAEAEAAFKAVRTAIDLAPREPDVAVAYGRTIQGISSLNAAFRFFAARHLGIDVKKEATRTIGLLTPTPGSELANHALAQLIRSRLAAYTDDSAAERDATALLAAMPSAQREAAVAELDSDSKRANDAANSSR